MLGGLKGTRVWRSRCLLGLFLLVCPALWAGQTVLFADDCRGPSLNPAWEAFLAETSLGGDRAPSANFLGASSFAFTTLEGVPVWRLANTLNRFQRRGWSTGSSFRADGFRYEVRFNTLVQSSQSSIDAFIEIWVLDAANPKRHDLVSPFGAEFSTNRRLFSGSSIDDAYSNQPFNYRNNTWYRLVLAAAPGGKLRASLCSDSGQELIGRDFEHGTETFKCGFKVGVAQAMGDPFTDPSPVQVAIGSITLTQIPKASAGSEAE